eukprot:snap_masked-scaffold285_size222332-processed-gene-1.4 protein:Tk07159 transcript:snap_masked-scaffold285_size222332-processed-gene-1.4-mRNA-1 annotation:"zinc finger protein 850-like isoform x3"
MSGHPPLPHAFLKQEMKTPFALGGYEHLLASAALPQPPTFGTWLHHPPHQAGPPLPQTPLPLDVKPRLEGSPVGCQVCGLVLVSKTSLKRHMMTHENNFPFKCSECAKSFKSQAELKRHGLVHSDDRVFKCPACHKGFKSRQEVKRHQTVHSEERPYKCNLCDKRFKSRSEWKRHTSVTHSEERKFQCQACFKAYKSSFELKRHAKSHLECELKNAVLSQPPLEVINSYPCDICGNRFATELQKLQHQLEHGPAKTFQCSHCEKAFKTLAELRRHDGMVHSDLRPHKCNVCGKGFNSANLVKRHQTVHTDERPYECGHCDKMFKSSYELKRHEKVIHEQNKYDTLIGEVIGHVMEH